MSINKIVYECVDVAISGFGAVDKSVFYEYLKEKYHFNFEKFGEEFSVVHKALEEVYGDNHFKIERAIIRILNQRARDGVYDRYSEVNAFSCMVNVFISETEKSLQKHKALTAMSNYAKDLEEKVKDANERLKNSERMVAIGETAAMVGHDIRNPLQAIAGEIYLQREDIADLPESEAKKSLLESVRAVEENVYYINKIVSDLQDFAKPLIAEEGEEVDINAIIADVMTIVPIPQTLQVEINIENGFPLICASPPMLKRALSNLVQNAVQAMPKGGKLTINAYTAQDKALVTVEDTGPGIPEDVKANLFKPLFTTKAKGQGLGLAVVKRLVEAQRAKVWFESEAGNGAKFIIELPIKKSQ